MRRITLPISCSPKPSSWRVPSLFVLAARAAKSSSGNTQGFALRQAVVEPRGEVRDFTWISTELAKRTGLSEKYYEQINAGVLCALPLKGKDFDFSLDPKKDHGVDEIWDAACRAASVTVSEGKEEHGLDWFKEHGFMLGAYSRLNWYLYPRTQGSGSAVRASVPGTLPAHRRPACPAHARKRSTIGGTSSWRNTARCPKWIDVCKFWEDALERIYHVDIKDFPFWLLTSRSMQFSGGRQRHRSDDQ